MTEPTPAEIEALSSQIKDAFYMARGAGHTLQQAADAAARRVIAAGQVVDLAAEILAGEVDRLTAERNEAREALEQMRAMLEEVRQYASRAREASIARAADYGRWVRGEADRPSAPPDPDFSHDRVLLMLAAPKTSGEVGTGAGEGVPRQDTGSARVTRSEDCPEAPAQAHLPVFDGPVAGKCRACGQDLVHEPGERTYHPWDVQWPEGKCPALLPIGDTGSLSSRVPDSEFIPDWKPLPEDVRSHPMWGGFPPHNDGRVCSYHSRLGKWTFDGINECLRTHPDPAARGDDRG